MERRSNPRYGRTGLSVWLLSVFVALVIVAGIGVFHLGRPHNGTSAVPPPEQASKLVASLDQGNLSSTLVALGIPPEQPLTATPRDIASLHVTLDPDSFAIKTEGFATATGSVTIVNKQQLATLLFVLDQGRWVLVDALPAD